MMVDIDSLSDDPSIQEVSQPAVCGHWPALLLCALWSPA